MNKGMAQNIGIALKCNAAQRSPELDFIDVERRRRCWAGILLLHTYQAILFGDVDMSFLLNVPATMPADINDADITKDRIEPSSTQPTQMSTTRFKIQLCRLSSRICQELSDLTKLDDARLELLDFEISQEQRQWDEVFLVDGSPSLLDTASYAHWCILQLYAHQLYLLLHRPFSRTRTAGSAPRYHPIHRSKCITSGAALLDIHGQIMELPRLRHYRWYAHGTPGVHALHGAVTLGACLLEGGEGDSNFDSAPYHAVYDAAVRRIGVLQHCSPLYTKAYTALSHLQ